MTASSFSSSDLLRTFYEQQRSSQQMFDSLREHLILQVSDAIKPLVKFLEAHECDEDEVMAAIFEAIAYEKDAELELGTFAFDQRNEWSNHCDDKDADEQSQALYRLGIELLRQMQLHRLYRHGFLPYQFTKRHGLDLVATRLGIPEIMHRDREHQDLEFRKQVWMPMPESELIDYYTELLSQKQPQHPRTQPAELHVPASVMAKFEEEMRKIFSTLQRGDETSPAAATPPDERSVMTQDELNVYYTELLAQKQREFRTGGSWMQPEKRRLMDLVHRAKVLGDVNAAHELEEHIAKTIRVVEERDEPFA